jgi:peroxiredoxin
MKGIIFGLLSGCFLVACGQKAKDEVGVSTVNNERPSLQVKMPDGTSADFKDVKGKAILILFQPDCDHCQQEAQQMHANLKAFREYKLYFISSSPMGEITKFAADYKLSGVDNVIFGWTTTENIINTFGPIQAPSVYIYSKEGKLVQEFNGQVDISVILKYL